MAAQACSPLEAPVMKQLILGGRGALWPPWKQGVSRELTAVPSAAAPLSRETRSQDLRPAGGEADSGLVDSTPHLSSHL